MFAKPNEEARISRRDVLKLGGAAVVTALLMGLPLPAEASPKEAKKRLAELTKGAKLQKGRVVIDLPALTQDGKRTRIHVTVDSPMTDEDHVKALHILAERNTYPNVASYFFSPMSGKVDITTRMRVAKSQTIIVAAEMSDGSVYYTKARCRVARGAGGCG